MSAHGGDRRTLALSKADRVLITAIVLSASVFPVDLQPGVQQQAPGAHGQLSVAQGEVVLVPVPVSGFPTEVAGTFMGRHIPFFQSSDPGPGTRYVGLVGVDMQDRPGTHELVVHTRSRKGERSLSYNVLVLEEAYPTQHLTLPSHQVDLDRKALVRVKAEQKEVREVLRHVSQQRYWTESFVEPVKGTVSGAFGRKRVINGQLRSPHSGEDIAALMGTEVVATNRGVVRLVADHFFSGKGLFIDHGLGMISMYFHLSEVVGREGEVVERGQVIGRVGASGRATGPHLHWGVRLNGARVNPYSLTNLPLDRIASSSVN